MDEDDFGALRETEQLEEDLKEGEKRTAEELGEGGGESSGSRRKI